MKRDSARVAQRFMSRMIAGNLLAVIIGFNVDEFFHTTPWIMLAMIAYVVVGSLYLLIRETSDDDGRK